MSHSALPRHLAVIVVCRSSPHSYGTVLEAAVVNISHVSIQWIYGLVTFFSLILKYNATVALVEDLDSAGVASAFNHVGEYGLLVLALNLKQVPSKGHRMSVGLLVACSTPLALPLQCVSLVMLSSQPVVHLPESDIQAEEGSFGWD